MFFHWSLSDSKFPQISRTLLSIRTDLNCAMVYMVLILPLISSSLSLLSRSVRSLPKLSTIIDIPVTFMFYNSQARSKNLSIFSFTFTFTLFSTGTAKSITSFFVVNQYNVWFLWLQMSDPFVSNEKLEVSIQCFLPTFISSIFCLFFPVCP